MSDNEREAPLTLDQLRAYIDPVLSDLSSSISNLNAQIVELEAREAETNAGIAALSDKIVALDEAVAELNDAQTETNKSVVAITTSLRSEIEEMQRIEQREQAELRRRYMAAPELQRSRLRDGESRVGGSPNTFRWHSLIRPQRYGPYTN